MAHWWLCFAWRMLQGEAKYETPIEHVGRMLSRCELETYKNTSRFIFVVLWILFLVAGVRLRRELVLSKDEQLSQWFQNEIRKIPADSNFVPQWPGHTGTPSLDLVEKFQKVNEPAAPSLDSLEVGDFPAVDQG